MICPGFPCDIGAFLAEQEMFGKTRAEVAPHTRRSAAKSGGELNIEQNGRDGHRVAHQLFPIETLAAPESIAVQDETFCFSGSIDRPKDDVRRK
jgi:hypothetical protein